MWNRDDFSQYHNAKDAWFSVTGNGKVDIGLERGDKPKISLTERGMLKMILEWLENMDHVNKLDDEKCDRIIKILQERKK